MDPITEPGAGPSQTQLQVTGPLLGMFTTISRVSLDVAVVAAVVVVFALVSRRIGPTVVSPPMVFVAAGLILGPKVIDVVDLGFEVETVALVGEVALAILLFSDATRIDLRLLRHDLVLPARLLGIGLPLTVAMGTGMVVLLFPRMSIAEAALIAAILAPTDAALGQEVVADDAVPARVRHGLIVESGLNDGLVVPVVAFFLVLANNEEEIGSTGFWSRFVFEQIGIGLLVGIIVGVTGAWLLTRSEGAGWADGVYTQLATLSVVIGIVALSIGLGGNGFIAAFVGGLAFGRVAPRAHGLAEYTEDTAQLAALLSFFLFGNVLLGPAIDTVSVQIVVCAVGALTIGRMIPVAIAMVGMGASRVTVSFIGWFGPRGLASILFGLLLIEEELPNADSLFGVIAWTVLLSIVLHGATAAWGARAYGRWWASHPDDDRDDMAEGVEVKNQRHRR